VLQRPHSTLTFAHAHTLQTGTVSSKIFELQLTKRIEEQLQSAKSAQTHATLDSLTERYGGRVWQDTTAAH